MPLRAAFGQLTARQSRDLLAMFEAADLCQQPQ